MSEEDIELLIDGARYDDAEDVQAALAKGVPVDSQDEQGRTALHMAAANGHVEILKILLSAGANVEAPNSQENTPLHYACLNGQTEAVAVLLSHGALPSALNSASRTPVDEALDAGHEAVMELIRSHTAAAEDGDAEGAQGAAEAEAAVEEADLRPDGEQPPDDDA